MTSRLKHIDVAKGIGMMLIVASHVWTTKDISETSFFKCWDSVLNSFYVPLFFILSGVFETKSPEWKDLFKRIRRLGRYIIIFAIFGFIQVGVLKGIWSLNSCFTGTIIWFLFTLFWISLIFGLLKHMKFPWPGIILCGIIGAWLSHNGHSYAFIGQAMLCLPFYALGFYFDKAIKDLNINSLYMGGVFVGYCISMLFYRLPQNVALNMVSQPYLTFYTSAILGAVLVIWCSTYINWKPMAWFGRNSIVPMCVQMLFINIIGRIYIADSIAVYVIEAIMAILLSAACIPLFRNKYYKIL